MSRATPQGRIHAAFWTVAPVRSPRRKGRAWTVDDLQRMRSGRADSSTSAPAVAALDPYEHNGTAIPCHPPFARSSPS